MKKIFLIGLVALLATVTSASANVNTNTNQYKSPNKVKYEKMMQTLDGISPNRIARIVSDNMVENIPQKIDFMTTLSGIATVDNSVIYHYDVSFKEFVKRYPDKDVFKFSKVKKQKLNELIISGQHKNILNTICRTPSLRAMVDSGVEFNYNYIIKSTGEPLGSFSVTSEDCKDFEL